MGKLSLMFGLYMCDALSGAVPYNICLFRLLGGWAPHLDSWESRRIVPVVPPGSPRAHSLNRQVAPVSQGCELVAPAGHVVKLWRGLKLGSWWTNHRQGGVVDRCWGLGSRGSFNQSLDFGFGVCSRSVGWTGAWWASK